MSEVDCERNANVPRFKTSHDPASTNEAGSSRRLSSARRTSYSVRARARARGDVERAVVARIYG